ncbi:MAG: UPF0149 family protein [Mariprofundales bacterium]
MGKISKPLSRKELHRLDDFLISRITDEEGNENKDEGIYAVCMLDGFLTAILSGPETLMPSHWLPAIWCDFEPEWNSERELKETMTLIMRHVNSISAALVEDLEHFEPLLGYAEVDGTHYMVADEWCEGYMRGVSLCSEAWNCGGESVQDMLTPIRLFGLLEMDDMLATLSEDRIVQIQQTILPAVRKLYRFWLSERKAEATSSHHVTADQVKVGRNDPCPCGSGKKFKRCCGSPLRVVH